MYGYLLASMLAMLVQVSVAGSYTSTVRTRRLPLNPPTPYTLPLHNLDSFYIGCPLFLLNFLFRCLRNYTCTRRLPLNPSTQYAYLYYRIFGDILVISFLLNPLQATPALVFCPLLNPYLEIFDLAKLVVADAPIKKNTKKIVLPPLRSLKNLGPKGAKFGMDGGWGV